jgi:hypothetical protein
MACSTQLDVRPWSNRFVLGGGIHSRPFCRLMRFGAARRSVSIW